MDQRRKDMLGNIEKMKIGMDEPFKFRCTMCGQCCIHREDILLNPKDVYNIAKELQLTPQEMCEQYCESYIGSDSRMPVVRIKPRGSVQRCPFLKKRKCSIHDAKPTVCAMFPIGRCVISDESTAKKMNIPSGRVQYIFTNPGCGDGTETHTVREWLETFDIPLEDTYFLQWNQVLITLCTHFRKAEKQCSNRQMKLAWFATYVGLYLAYDMEKEFLPQFEENVKKITELIQTLPTNP